MPKQFTSWSFSRWSDYRQCPAKAKYKHLDKLPEPTSEALSRGSAIHEKAEKYIKAGGARLPAELKKFKDLFKHLRKKHKEEPNKVWVEESWSFTRDWKLTRWDDWVGCVVRLKVDCVELEGDATLLVRDWKTGKFRSEGAEAYMAQLDLYALGALLQYPNAVVLPRLYYLDTGDIYPPDTTEVRYTQDNIPTLKQSWERRVEPMLNDTIFAPTPTFLCRWCHYRKENGGPCQF